MTIADFNGDGVLDLALALDTGTNQTVAILLGNSDGTFQNAMTFSSDNPVSLTTADFNGDGRLDLAVASPGSQAISVLLGNGDGTFQDHVDFPTNGQPFSLSGGDFNGDGRPDLVATGNNNVLVLLQSPVVSLSPPTLQFGDVNVGTSSTPQNVMLTNTGSAALNISDVAIRGANAKYFSQQNNCSSTIPPGGNCNLTHLSPSDRILAGWLTLWLRPTRLLRSAIVLKPSTLLGLHQAMCKQKYRMLFSSNHNRKPGPKGPSAELVHAIVEMKQRNPRWGGPRIAEQITLAFNLAIDKDVVQV